MNYASVIGGNNIDDTMIDHLLPDESDHQSIRSFLVDVANNPGKYTTSEKIPCSSHSWMRYPMWCHYNNGNSISYCTKCNTSAIFGNYGDVKEYSIRFDIYNALRRYINDMNK